MRRCSAAMAESRRRENELASYLCACDRLYIHNDIDPYIHNILLLAITEVCQNPSEHNCQSTYSAISVGNVQHVS